MTDAELIARLRDAVNGEHDMTPHGADVLQAADRIEELLAERDEAKAMQSCGCSYDTPTDICLGHHRLFERLYAVQRGRLEAKLAKAVKLIDLAVELARWDRAPKLRDDMIDFTTDIKEESHDPL